MRAFSPLPYLILLSTALPAQDRARQAMDSSISRQKAAVRRQISPENASAPGDSSWFTTAWPTQSIAPMGPPAVPLTTPSLSTAFPAPCDPVATSQISPVIKEVSLQHSLQEDLVRAVMERESAFRPCAVSPKGAQGLMQLMPATAQELGVRDPFDVRQNVEGGARLLKQLLTKYKGNVELALGAYNAGSARVDKEGGVPNIPETKDYVLQILNKLTF